MTQETSTQICSAPPISSVMAISSESRERSPTYLAYKYRLYPTKEQQVLLAKTFGCVRWIYNWGLAKKIKVYEETQKGIGKFALITDAAKLKNAEETAWLAEVNSQALQSGLAHLHIAFQGFFKKKTGFPRFKSKYDRQSFANPQNSSVDFEASLIYIPKFKAGIKAVLHRKFDGKVKTVTVSKTKTGKYYASVLVETGVENPIPLAPVESTTVGIDLGVKTYAVLSDGTKIKNPKHLDKKLRYLKRQQRWLSRKKKGSKNRDKQRTRVARIHEKVSNSRNDFLHQTTAQLVKNQDYQSFAIEDLSVADMLEKSPKHLARNIADASFGTFRTLLSYKAARAGKNVLVIGRFDPSSKLCSCGYLNSNLTLKDRAWECPCCKVIRDRDLLAAQNIKRFAFGKAKILEDRVF